MDAMDMISGFVDQTKGCGWCVALPESGDGRILAAARWLKDQDIAEPILLGARPRIESTAREVSVAVDDLTIIDPVQSERLDAYVEAYVAQRGLAANVARRIVCRPLYYAGMMVACGDADTMVAGVAHTTAAVIAAGVLTVGLTPGIKTVSSFFLMVLPQSSPCAHKTLIYADCGVNIAPTPSQLADIATSSSVSARLLLGEEPRVAMLSFSTKGSATHAHVDRVVEAIQIVRKRSPGVRIDGEFQADAALVQAVAARKVDQPSEVAGRANVLIFPDLNSGNIAYKLTQYLAGATAIGPLLQGFARPISDLSRGATVDDIIAAVVICLVQIPHGRESTR
jgi:phosphate acetyltransferase